MGREIHNIINDMAEVLITDAKATRGVSKAVVGE